MDDLKISHDDPKQVTRIIERLKKLYGQHGDLTVSRGKRHEYLGMVLDYSKKGKVIVNMAKYKMENHKMFLEELTRTDSAPAAKHPFEVKDDVE